MCVLIFSTNFVRNNFHSKKNWARYDKKCVLVFVWITRYSSQILTELELSLRIFERYWNMKFYENTSSGSRVFPCGQTDMTKLIVAFLQFCKCAQKVSTTFFTLDIHNLWPTTRLTPNHKSVHPCDSFCFTAVEIFKRNILGCGD